MLHYNNDLRFISLTDHVSYVMFHVSHVTWHESGVGLLYFFYKVFGLVGGKPALTLGILVSLLGFGASKLFLSTNST